MTDYLIYTRKNPPCSFCMDAKELLERNGLEYREVDVDEEGVREFFSERGFRTVPQIFYRGKHLGNFNTLEEFLK